jgi:hypothetical protein
MKTRVVNVKGSGGRYDVYIGRRNHPHHWGNPFIIGRGGTRDEVIRKFELWLSGVAYTDLEPGRRKWILANVHGLEGKILGCHCSPKPCHGDVLARWAETDHDSLADMGVS